MQQLIFLHGALGSKNHFDNIEKELASDFIIHKFPFSGHSFALGNGPISIQAYVDELAQYCKQQEIKNADFFGYSMGGYIALVLAQQHPEFVGKIMTLGTKYLWTPEIAQKETRMLVPEIIKEKVPKYAQSLQALHGDSWEELMLGVAQLLLNLGENPLLNAENLAQLEIPVQVMVGDKDNLVSIEETMALAKVLNHSNFAVLPNTTHPFEKVNKALILQLINDFF